MSKLNTNSNVYTIAFLIVMVIIVGGALAAISDGLKDTIDKNKELDNKSKILKSVSYEGTNVLEDYNARIKAIAINSDGEILDGVDGYKIATELKKEYKKSKDEIQYPVFIYNYDGKISYIVPLVGMGLWDEVNGYISYGADLNTIQGVAFDHVGETPGLGGEITKDYFQDRFKGKKTYNDDGSYALKIYKSGKSPDTEFDVDGLSGATLTTDGMDAMLSNCIPNYKKYFNSLKK